jgi:bifunctional non-homologous end joining protein LigD
LLLIRCEAVVLGPDGLSRFEELSRREATRTALLYAFDLIELDGEDLRDRPFLERKAALAGLLRDTKAGILFNEQIAQDGPVVFAHACRLGAEGIVSKKVDSAYQSQAAFFVAHLHSVTSMGIISQFEGAGRSFDWYWFYFFETIIVV